ncbi:hypothetical protein ABZ915_09485 [Streptomyces sp. NPDC046915]|uniref:hypothetical protein n=1 Tax=Streptomyces sp. NPDC046915 TaxID=3155257 RepID=UPI0033FFB803
MQWTDESGGAYGEDPYGGLGYAYAHGHEYRGGTAGTDTMWDSPHGDVLTVPPADLFDTPGRPVPEPDTTASGSERPVFVDSSGRRQRRVRRAARLLLIPAVGYVALLISTVLGGPGLSAPFVPQSHSTHPAPHASVPGSTAGGSHSAGSTRPVTARNTSRATEAQHTSRPSGRPTTPAPSAAASAPTTAPTTTPAPARTPASKGRALGSSHKPVK